MKPYILVFSLLKYKKLLNSGIKNLYLSKVGGIYICAQLSLK